MFRVVLFLLFLLGFGIVYGDGMNVNRSDIDVKCRSNNNSGCDSLYYHHLRTDDVGNKAVQVMKTESGFKLARSNEGIGARKKKKKDMFSKILPMLIIPYLVQSSILPMMLMSIKFMLLKTFLVGKLALILILINAFRTRYSNQNYMQHLMAKHYGYNGGEEYGSYVN